MASLLRIIPSAWSNRYFLCTRRRSSKNGSSGIHRSSCEACNERKPGAPLPQRPLTSSPIIQRRSPTVAKWRSYSTISGIILIVVAMNDRVPDTAPREWDGMLTHLLFRTTWSLTRHRRRRVPINGTLTVLITIGVWVALVAVGWALIYLPYIPEGFVYTGIDPHDYPPFAEAITTSLVMLTTLGLGDTVPAAPLLRLLSPLEALADSPYCRHPCPGSCSSTRHWPAAARSRSN